MGKDKARPGSLGARLLNFGRSRIQRYTADGDTPETPVHSETPPPPTPSVYSSAPPAQPTMPPPIPSELPPVTRPREIRPQETLTPEARPGRAVRRAPRETEAAPASPPPPHPEQNPEDRPRQTIGRDLLFILQRHEELQTGQESDNPDSGESFSDTPSPSAPPTQGRRLGRRPAPTAPASPPESPPPGTPMPRRPRPTAEGSAASSAPPAPPNVARTPAPQPAAEPEREWEIAHFDDGDEDTAALYDGDTVRYAQPETPPSAVPRRTQPESRPLQRKPAAPNRESGGKPRKASPPEAPKPQTRPTREQINRTPESPAENPPPHYAASAPQQHNLPLIEDVDDYEMPPLSDSFELNAGFDLTHQPGTPAAPVQRSEPPQPPAAPHSPVEHAFTEALPVALPPTRRGRGFIEEFPTQQPEVHDDAYEVQPDYDLPYFDEETDRVTEQIDDYSYDESAAPNIALMRQDAPPSPVRPARQSDASRHHQDADVPSYDDFEADAPSSPLTPEPILPRHELPSALHRAAEDTFDASENGFPDEYRDDGDDGYEDASDGGFVDVPSPAQPRQRLQRRETPPELHTWQPSFSTHKTPESGDVGDAENPYTQDFDDTSESDFDSRPDLYEALLRAGMVHNTPPESHDAPIYRAPDPAPAVMPSFEGVYDDSTYDTGDDADGEADTIYNYDDDESEPEILPDASSGEEMPFGSVEASLHDLMRYADDETNDGDESSNYHTAVSFDDEDSDLYHVEFDPNADDDSSADHDYTPSERTPGQMIRRFADAQSDLLRLLDLPPDTPVSHGHDDDSGDEGADDEGDEGDFEAYDYDDRSPASAPETAPRTSRPAEPTRQPISLADALAAPPVLPPAPPQTYIAREMDSGDEAGESGGATTAEAGETDESKNPSENTDVDKLAREVYRKLRSRLRIEQERRSD